jgi:multicomponent Na+:H+ antiporter subunit D
MWMISKMNELIVVSAPLAALLTGVLCLFFWNCINIQRLLNLLGALLHFTLSLLLLSRVYHLGPQVLKLGAWAAPYGIVYVADLMSALMLVVTGFLSSVIALYNFSGGIDEPRERFGFHALSQFLVFGVSGAFVTGDVFHLYVCFEILLMSSFVLMVLGNGKEQLAGAFKYLVINLLSSTFFLLAVGMLYAQMGTLNFADLSAKLSSFQELPVSLQIISHLMFVGFGIKAGLFPFFFWLPASYHNPPIPVSALFAGLLTKVGLYSMIRLYTFMFPHTNTGTMEWLWWISVATMVVGVLGAVSKMHIRRILSVHIISQVGYVTLALALMTPLAIAAALYYMIHNMIAKTSLFLISGVVESASGTDYLKRTGGFFYKRVWLAVLFLISALGLAGLPPLSGFFAKLFVVKASIDVSSYGSVLAALGVSVFTLFSMLKIWNEAFWKAPPVGAEFHPENSFCRSWHTPQMLAVLVLSLGVLAMGVFAGPLFDLLLMAAKSVSDPSLYVTAVLGVRGTL